MLCVRFVECATALRPEGSLSSSNPGRSCEGLYARHTVDSHMTACQCLGLARCCNFAGVRAEPLQEKLQRAGCSSKAGTGT